MNAEARTRGRNQGRRLAATVLTALLLAGAVCGAGSASAASVTLAWNPNPPAEQVKTYRLLDGDTTIWEGTTTEATVELAPGAHTLTGVACTEAINPDGTKVPLCSAKSQAVSAPVSGGMSGLRVVIITVSTQ